MFGLGTGEIVAILLVVVVLFGAKRLPELGRGLGAGMRGFKDSLRGKDDEPPTTPKSDSELEQKS